MGQPHNLWGPVQSENVGPLFKSRKRVFFLFFCGLSLNKLWWFVCYLLLFSLGDEGARRAPPTNGGENTHQIPLLLCPHSSPFQEWRVAAVSGQWQESKQLRAGPKEVRSGQRLDHRGSMPPAHAPLPHLTSFTKCKLKDTVMQNFKTMTTPH